MTTVASAPPTVHYRSLVARGIRILNHAGLMHASGHVALRDAGDPNVMWINSRKASRSTIVASDVIAIDLRTGERIGEGDEAPSEFHIHRAIFNRRPDVHAICHTHPEHIVALSLAGKTLQPVHPSGGFLPESAPMFDDANLINTAERGEAVARTLGTERVVVLRGHGIVVTASSFEAVVAHTVCSEENARFQYLAVAIGEPTTIAGPELDVARRTILDPKVVRKHYHYHEENAREAGALKGLG